MIKTNRTPASSAERASEEQVITCFPYIYILGAQSTGDIAISITILPLHNISSIKVIKGQNPLSLGTHLFFQTKKRRLII